MTWQHKGQIQAEYLREGFEWLRGCKELDMTEQGAQGELASELMCGMKTAASDGKATELLCSLLVPSFQNADCLSLL